MTELNLHPEQQHTKETSFQENAQVIIQAGETIQQQIEQDPRQVDRKESDNEYAVAVGYKETIKPFIDAIRKNPNAQLILSYGLTRCGKSLSMIKVFKAINANKHGSAAYFDLQGTDQQASIEQLIASIEARVQMTTRGATPKLLILDEVGPFLVQEGMSPAQVLQRICAAFPNTTITTIDVYGRNRGKVVKTDLGTNPNHRYSQISRDLQNVSIESVVHAHRDGWLQSSIQEALIALSPEPEKLAEQLELVHRTAIELGAFAMGNPFVIRHIVNEFREQNMFGNLENIRQILFDANKFMLSQPNYFQIDELYEHVDIHNVGSAFNDAFGGYQYSDMLSKLRVISLTRSEAAQDIPLDWASWGRFDRSAI